MVTLENTPHYRMPTMTESDLQAARNLYSDAQRAKDESMITFAYQGARRTRDDVYTFTRELQELALDYDSIVSYRSDLSRPGIYVYTIESYSPGMTAALFEAIVGAYPRRNLISCSF